MLVCNISIGPPRRAITADLEEVAAATDFPFIDNAIYATLIDDPANTLDIVDAFIGEIMLEPASAADSVDAGSIYGVGILENIAATDVADGGTGPQTITAAMIEPAAAADAPNAIIPPVGTTWNPADLSSIALSNGNLTATCPSFAGAVRGIAGLASGKYYWEATMTTWNQNATCIGIALSSASLGSAPAGSVIVNQNGYIFVNGSNIGWYGGSFSNGAIIGIAVDFTNKLFWFRVGPTGNWNNSGTNNPATGTGGVSFSVIAGSQFFPFFFGNNTGESTTANFGASAFSGAAPSGFTAGWPA